MTTDWKAFCVQLVQELESAHEDIGLINRPRTNLINRVRAALADKPWPYSCTPEQQATIEAAAAQHLEDCKVSK